MRIVREDGVGHIGTDVESPQFFESEGSILEGSTTLDEIVNNHNVFSYGKANGKKSV